MLSGWVTLVILDREGELWCIILVHRLIVDHELKNEYDAGGLKRKLFTVKKWQNQIRG